MANYTMVQKWFSDGGDDKFRINYELNQDSIVIDLGGYRGTWAEKIFYKYNCNIFIFEPIPDYYEIIKNKFEFTDKVKVFNLGVSSNSEEKQITILNDGSSFHLNGENKVTCKLVPLLWFLEENKLSNVDLLKINVEGDEYDILNNILENNAAPKFKNIQVQFHDFVPDCVETREHIRSKLSNTHHLTYDYEFVWENWEINE